MQFILLGIHLTEANIKKEGEKILAKKYSAVYGKRTTSMYYNPYVKTCRNCGTVGKIVTSRTYNPIQKKTEYKNWCQSCGIGWDGNKQYPKSKVAIHSIKRSKAEPWDKKMRNKLSQKRKLEYIKRFKVRRIPNYKKKNYHTSPKKLGFYF